MSACGYIFQVKIVVLVSSLWDGLDSITVREKTRQVSRSWMLIKDVDLVLLPSIFTISLNAIIT
jgi:hypothetical protein